MTSHRQNPKTTQPDDWQPARGDEVVHLARLMRGRKTRRKFLKAGVGVAGGLIALVGGWWLFRLASSEREYDFGGITCSEVAASSDDFMQGRLPPDQATKVKQHVRRCPNCKPKFERMGGMKMLGRAMPACRRTTEIA